MKTIPLEEALPCRILALIVLVLFYGIYFGKTMAQKRKGIQTRQIGRRKEKNIHTVELLMSAATLLAPASQLLSLVLGLEPLPGQRPLHGLPAGPAGGRHLPGLRPHHAGQLAGRHPGPGQNGAHHLRHLRLQPKPRLPGL